MDYHGTNGNDVINQATLAIPDGANIYGNEGDDVITIGNAYAIGGAGNDTITGTASSWSGVAYWTSPARVVVNLQTGEAQDGFGTVDTLENISELQGSRFDDHLTGSTANESFHGGRGNNIIVGGGGSDTVYYYGQNSTNVTITYNAAMDTVTVVKNFTDGDHGTDILTGISTISFGGPGSDDMSLGIRNFVVEGGFLRATGVSSAVFTVSAPSQFRTGDFNGDGRADYLLATQNGLGTVPSPMFVFLGDGAGRFVDGTSTVFSSPPMNIVGGGRTLVADFNRDGISDVLQLNFGLDAPPFPGGLNSLYLSSSVTQKLADISATLVQQTAQNHALSAGDVNGDGFIDVLVNTLDLGNQLYLNDGTGHFVLRQDLIPHPMSGASYLTNLSSGIVDVNGDGAPDLILGRWDAGHSASASQVLLNDGTGNFTRLAPITLPASTVPLENVLDVKGIDINGDGRTDLMLSITHGGWSATSIDGNTYYMTAYIQLLVNQGNGNFTDETATRLPASVQDAFGQGWFIALAAVDIDRDGHPDIVATGADGAASVVLMNRGDGTFYQSWTSEVGGRTIAADVNGDGMLDLLTNVRSNTYVEINTLPNGHIYKAAIDGNHLMGSSGNDTMFGGPGNDIINGGAGIDTAVFSGNRASYAPVRTFSGFTVSGPDGSDTLTSIERFQFSDKGLAFDLGLNTAGGNTVRIIGAAFDAPTIQQHPDYVGIGLNLFDSGQSMLAVCQLVIGAMGNPTNVAFVNTVYQNVVGVLPSAAERDYYVGLLQGSGGTMTQAELLILAANADVNAQNINLVGLQTTGVEFI